MNTLTMSDTTSKKTDQELSLTIKSFDVFSQFLNRFTSMDKQLLLEITPLHLKAKLGTSDRSCIKSEKIDLESVFEIEDFENIPDLIQIGILNAKKLVDTFKHFNDKQAVLKLTYLKLGNNLVAQNIEINSTSLNINFDCADSSLFRIISDDVLEAITSKEDVSIFFKLTKDQFNKIQELTKLVNGDEDHITLDVDKSNNIIFKSKSFSYIIEQLDSKPKNFSKSDFKKSYFSFVDKDIDLIVYLKDDCILFEASEHSSLKLLIGKADV